ncbi:hypothetical protein DmAi_16690 [Acetobacter persici]|uniref:Uncharacterized protein n=1 Tax=Acetobacter persici TaxID=1076596 RepID=A0A6V8I7S7_9PROT|nr:hypothetical protein DmAi_16690 [Acetobacter persici]
MFARSSLATGRLCVKNHSEWSIKKPEERWLFPLATLRPRRSALVERLPDTVYGIRKLSFLLLQSDVYAKLEGAHDGTFFSP